MSFAPGARPPLVESRWHFRRQRPTTCAGTWSIGLVDGGFAFVVLLALFMGLTGAHADVGPVSLLGVSAFAGLIAIIAGGVLATIAILRRAERSVFVLATLPVWVMATFLVVGELAVPH